MIRRLPSFAGLCLIVCLLSALPAIPAVGVEVAPDLQAALATKGAEDRVPVLLVFGDRGLDKAAIPGLASMAPETRRRVVIDAQRERARLANGAVLAALDRAVGLGDAGNVRELYLADAITFEANAAGVAALAALPDQAHLHFDRPYDLTRAARVESAPESSHGKAADFEVVWNIKYIRAPKVWSDLGYTGAGVVVGHIDTGVMLDHTDLQDRLWVNADEIPGNGLDDDGNGFVDDIHGYDFGDGDGSPDDDSTDGGHGTHTAGTIAGDGAGGLHTGVAPGAELIVTKVYRSDGGGGSLGSIWAAQQYCVENGARILSMSLVLSGDIPVTFLRNDRFNAANIRDAGVTFFNSAGNEYIFQEPPLELGLTARVPAPWISEPVPHSSTGGVISVGGLGYMSDVRYSLSSRGPAKWDHVDGGYSGDTWSGTSMACPAAAGVAALMLEKNPSLSPAGIDSLMELNAVDLGEPGKDNEFGSGRVDAFITVSAVPETRMPDLVHVEMLPDPDGDSVYEPGADGGVAFVLHNNGPVTDARGVTGRLAVVENPWVTVANPEAVFGDLAAGTSGDNVADPFTISIDPGAPQGYGFTMLLTVADEAGFSRTFDVPWYVGLPEWRTHDAGRMYLTVTDQGILGYMGMDQQEGHGMGRKNGDSDLFLGSFWAGTGPDYVCNRDYEGLGAERFEWVVSNADPIGRVSSLGRGNGQMFQAVFDDGGHAEPRGLMVEQTSLAVAGPPDEDYVILEYKLTNHGAVDMAPLYTGLYCDFDVSADNSDDMAGTDPGRNLTYQFAPRGLYYGIALLGETAPANLSVVSNSEYVYRNSHVTDEDKFGFLAGEISVPIGKLASDWSGMVSAAVDLPAAGGEAKVAFALVIGENLNDLKANVDAAYEAYTSGVMEPGTEVVPSLRLAQNEPNPFNPSTRINFTLEKEGRISLTVYDLRGWPVRTILDEVRGEGDHTITWNGKDDRGARLPSGLYLYRLEAGEQRISRKMTLIK
jgi:subtilisin family serine protease